jgi:hypothetical protein
MLSVGKGLASISFSSRCVPHTLPPPHFVIALCPPSSVAPSLQRIHCAHETHRLHKQAILHTVSRPFTGVVASKQRLGKLCGASSCHSGESCARLAWSPRARSLPETGVCVRMCLGERAGESESERASEREVTNVCVCVLQGKIEAEKQRALFAVTYGDKVLRFSLQLPPDGDRHSGVPAALVRPLRQQSFGVEGGREEEAKAAEVASELSKWFSQLELDLEGFVFSPCNSFSYTYGI